MSRGAVKVICLALAIAALAAPASASSNPFFGVDGVNYPTQADLTRAGQGGVGTFGMQFFWGNTEPHPGDRIYATTDQLVAEAARAGVTVLPDLSGVPSWISRISTRPPIHTAGQRAAWRSLLTDFARRYGANGTFWALHPELPKRPITTWEIWNEPNLPGFWGGKPSARGFARLLRISAAGLRAGDPSAQVLTGGVFPFHTIHNTVDMTTYLDALYRVHGVKSSFDALGIHPYSTTPKGVLHWVRVARRIMRRHGDGATPIWVSEFGWVTGGRKLKSSPVKATLGQQASKLSRTYALLQRHAASLGIARALWFSYTDHRTTGPAFWTDRAGLFNLDGAPKPAWYAYARAAGGTP
jgi:polysaccharide biosynthesis protein PslG